MTACAVPLLLLLTTGCSTPSSAPEVAADVVLLGDSLAEEAAPFLHDLLGDAEVVAQYYGGTAPCDWLGRDVLATRGRVVVVTFTGNALTPCMSDDDGEFLRGPALVDKYRADLTALVDDLRATGAEVVLVGQPRRGPAAGGGGKGDIEVEGINAIYAELAAPEDVTFVDAGAAVEAPDGGFALALPCLPGEAECGTTGHNAVRSDDGVHLCPGTAPTPCPVYSSGAYRFAEAIAAALRQL